MEKELENRRTLVIDLICDIENSSTQYLKTLDSSSTDILFQKKEFSNNTSFNKLDLIDFDDLYSKVYDAAFKEVIDFGEFKLDENTSLAKAFTMSDGKSLWYYFRFMVLYKYRKQLFEKQIVEHLNKLNSKYDKCIVLHNSGFLEGILKPSKKYKSIRIKKKNDKNRLNVLSFLLISLVRFFNGLFSIHLFYDGKVKYVLLSNAHAEQNVISKRDIKLITGDHFSEYLQSDVEDRSDYINVSEFYPPKLTSNSKLKYKKHYTTSRYKRTINIESILYLQLFNPWFYSRAFKEIKRLRYAYNLIESRKEGGRVLNLMTDYKRLCYFIAIRKSALYSIFKHKNLKSVISTNEHDSRVKSVMEVASGFDLKSFGIQHGVIHFRHLHYTFSKADAMFSPFPDFTFMWGDYWRKSLNEFSSYPQNSLEIVGQVRTDVIPTLNKKKKKELIKNLDSSRYTIMYPSQPLYIGEEKMREKLAIDFLNLSIEFPDFQFVIKPHPLENDCNSFFNGLAKQLGTTNYSIINDDLYKLLSFSDLVIIYNSTVGAEAVYFRKPLVVMNYSQNDFSGFIKDKIALEVNDYSQLKESVLNISSGKVQTNESEQEQFIRQRAYKIDGNVTKRIIEFVVANSRS